MSATGFNLNLLRSLLVILETRNLTEAGKQLGLTQSALSRQLAQLREQLGDPLLIREGRDYLLTTRAQAMLAPLRSMLATMETVLEAPVFDPAACSRRFSLSASDYIADFMLPTLLDTLHIQAPRLELVLRMWGPDQYRWLAEDIDLVPTMADAIPENLHGRAMGQDVPVVAMCRHHPLAAGPLALADYIAAGHVLIGGGGNKNGPVDRALASMNLARRVVLEVPFYGSAVRILTGTRLLLTLPQHIATVMATSLPIAWQPLPFEAPVYRYWLLWHARNHHDAAHQWFRNQVYAVLLKSMHGVTQFNQTYESWN
ncbi:LysR family transcriptional regulator [Chitinimonas sp.]|uniref:LysR family transcriptional regulator n=1 Tax=Chitinimonas sp. TaxID=1934313 RepID=UPI0035AF9D8E